MRLTRLAAALALILPAAAQAAVGALSQGVVAGDLRHDAAMLWAMPNVAGSLSFEVATDAAFTQVVLNSSPISATPGVAAKWDATGLAAGTTYFYRATDFANNMSSGTFTTPFSGGFNGLRFGVSGDWQGELTPYPAFGNVAGRNLNFFVQLGDTIYAEDYHTPGEPTAATLAEYRAKYAQALTLPPVRPTR